MKDKELRDLLLDMRIIDIGWFSGSLTAHPSVKDIQLINRKIDLILKHLNLETKFGMRLKRVKNETTNK